MRSRVRSVLALAVLAAAAWPPVAPRPAPAAAQESADALRSEVERLRGEMERAWLDAQGDHVKVRAAGWADVQLVPEFTAVLDGFVKDARARPRGTGDEAKSDRDAADAAVRDATARRVDAPLTPPSLLVVLAQTAKDAAADATADPRSVFVAAARKVFAEAKLEDVWDAWFTALPVVTAYREARSKLDALERTPPEPPKDPLPAPETPRETPAPERPAEKPAVPAEEPVFLDRARAWLGPWTGWPTPEKLNKRQQRQVRAVWMDRFEVTCAQYLAFLEAAPAASRRALLPQGWTIDETDAVQMPTGRERHPVTGVTWRQATAFAEAHSKRLPSSDEWERAAAGAEKEPRTYPWGASEEGRSWVHLGVEPKGTFPVDAHPDDVTPEGVAGLAGNVAELVATYPDRTEVARTGPEKNRQVLVCGGSFASRASECVTSWRWVLDGDGSSPSVGFRCVMDDAEYRKRNKR